MSLFSGKTSNAAADSRLLGYPVSTSVKGRPLALLWGTDRVSPQVIWTGNFRSKALGSKAKGGGGKGGSGQQYDYNTAIILAVCQGQILLANTLWDDQVTYSPSNSLEVYTVPPGGGTYTPQFATQRISDLGVYIPTAFSHTANDYGSPGSTTLTGTQNVQLTPTNSPTPGPGEYYVDPATGSYTFNAAQAGDGVYINYIWNQSSSTHGAAPASAIGFTIILGAIGQAPWSYLTSSFPDQALGYSEMGLMVAETFDLGSAGVAPNLSIEIYGRQVQGGGILDAPIIVPPVIQAAGNAPGIGIIGDMLTDPTCGAGFFAFELGDSTDLGTYCYANGLFVSLLVDSQQDVSSILKELLTIANGECFWSEGVLKFRSYGDTSAVGNGATYTPQTAPIYDLDADDFLGDAGDEDYYTVERTTVRDAYNRVVVEWKNRDNSYNPEPAHQDDQWSQLVYGGIRVDSPMQLHSIKTQSVASQVAATKVQRNVYIRQTHKFKLPIIYWDLEPMDLVTVTVPEEGLFKTPVRILTIEETESDTESYYEIEAEDFPWGTAKPTLHPKQVSSTFGPGFFAPPGPVNTPNFIDVPEVVTQGSPYTLGIALSGANQWGGTEAFISTDGGGSYTSIGRQVGQATMGVLTGALPYNNDPDNTNTLAVDLLQSFGALDSFTKNQADKLVSLVSVDDELMAYQTATLTAAYTYNVDYLRRGAYGSSIGAHAAGAPFTVIDDLLFYWGYDDSVVGTTVWFKFCSFNQYNQNQQSISDVEAFPHFIEGPRLPYPWSTSFASQPVSIVDPLYPGSSFSVQQNYSLQIDGYATPQFFIEGYGVINTFSEISRPPTVTLTPSTTGGTIPGGATIVIGVTVLDANGGFTKMTKQSFTFPLGTNTNSMGLAVGFFDPVHDQYSVVYVAQDPEQGWALDTIIGTGSPTGTITAIPSNFLNLAPDEDNAGYYVQATLDEHGGIWGGVIGPVTSLGGGQCSVQVPGSTWSTNQLAGRIFSLLASQNISAPMELVNCLIVSNTADTFVLNFDLVGGTQYIFPGDIVEIRTMATVYSANTIGDSNFVNGGAGQAGTGLTVNAEKGNIAFILKGTGQGQQRLIASNTNTTLTLATNWRIVPDATSVFIILNPSVQYTTSAASLPATNNTTQLFLNIDLNNIAQNTWFLQIFTVDAQGNSSLSAFSPSREIFTPGCGGTVLITASGSQT